MPATRTHIDRDIKRRQILDAAEGLFLVDGYEASSMAAIARGAGVANNAVYWYFPSKDDLLAGVLDRRLERALESRSEWESGDPEERLLAMLAQLDELANLTAAVHERAPHNPALAEAHAAFHEAADRLLQGVFLDSGLGREDAGHAARAMMALVEGIHLHDKDRDITARDELVLWTFRRLAAPD